jgi:hypothetical protein
MCNIADNPAAAACLEFFMGTFSGVVAKTAASGDGYFDRIRQVNCSRHIERADTERYNIIVHYLHVLYGVRITAKITKHSGASVIVML